MPHQHNHGENTMTRDEIVDSLQGEIAELCVKALFQGVPEVGGMISFELGLRVGIADPALARLLLDWYSTRFGENPEAVVNVTDVVDDLLFHVGEVAVG